MPAIKVDSIVLTKTNVTIPKGKFSYLSFLAFNNGVPVRNIAPIVKVDDKKIASVQYYSTSIAITALSEGTTEFHLEFNGISSNTLKITVIPASTINQFFSKLYFSRKYFSAKYFR